MVDSYLRELRSLLDEMGAGLESSTEIECKHFFSGAAAYADGRVFMSLTPVGLGLKLPEPELAALMGRGGTPLRYFPKAPVKKGYAVVPDSIRGDEEQLGRLVEASIEYCRSLPKPKARKATPSKRRSGGGRASGG